VYLEIIALLIIALAAFAHYRVGIWAAVLSLFGIALAGAIAFGFFLPLSQLLHGVTGAWQFWSDGLTLLLLFWVSFLFLRLVAEQLLKNAMPFRPLIDTIGGAVIGAICGYFIAGIFAVFAQMMPAPPAVLGYQPFSLNNPKDRDHLALRYDEVVLGIYNGLSAHALALDDTSLAGHYPARQPSAQGPVAKAFGGSSAEDILYYYFRRRVEFAEQAAESLGIYAEVGHGGAALTPSPKTGKFPEFTCPATSKTNPAIKLNVEKVWITPALAWDKPDGHLVYLTPEQFEWVQPDGSLRKGLPGEALLVVQVAFKPDWSALKGDAKEQPFTVPLTEWYLDSVFKEKQAGSGRAAAATEFKNPKLWLPAKVTGTATAASVMPLEALGKDALLDVSMVEKKDLVWDDKAGLKADEETFVVLPDGVWTFEPDSPKVKATLVFLVPSLSQVWQYGLKCGIKPETAGSGHWTAEDGLTFGYKEKFGPVTIEAKKIERKTTLAEIKGKAAPGNEFFVLDLSISKNDPAVFYLTSKDLKLTNTELKAEYPAALLESSASKEARLKNRGLEALLDGEPPPPKAEAPKAGAPKVEAPKVEAPKETKLYRNWEFVSPDRSVTLEGTFVFEVPRGKPAAQYKLTIPESLSKEVPEWYVMGNIKPARVGYNTVKLVAQRTVDELPMVDANGKEMPPYKVSEGSNAEMVMSTLAFTPTKPGDTGVYELKAEDITWGIRGDNNAWKELKGPFAIKPPGETSFHRLKQGEILRLRGTANLGIALYATKGYSGLHVTVKGYPVVELKQVKEWEAASGSNSAAPGIGKVTLGSTKTVDILQMVDANLHVIEPFKAPGGGNSEIVLVEVIFTPEQPGVYKVKVEDISWNIRTGNNWGEQQEPTAFKRPGAPGFRSLKPEEFLTFSGRSSIEAALCVTKGYDGLRVNVKGFPSVELKMPAASK
jgi:hypothetical protein